MDIKNVYINGINSAYSFLKAHDLIKPSDLIQIRSDLKSILENYDNYEDAKPHINLFCKEYADLILVQRKANSQIDGDKDFHDLIHICTECVLINLIHDDAFQLVCEYAKEDDRNFFKLCEEFCQIGVTAEQFGAPENYAIPLIAAIVELASLDDKKSPLDKLNCLCSTYDLIFAELKSALIDVISQTSDNTIPVIDNLDVIPILMAVIVRAKPVHIYSNLLLIEHFCNTIKFDRDSRSAFKTFKTAVEKIWCCSEQTLNPKSDKVCRDLDLHELIIISGRRNLFLGNNDHDDDDDEDDEHREKLTTLQLQTQRVIDLVTASTFKNNA